MDVYLETGPQKVFVCALDWPGYCRGGKTDDAALAALIAYGDRYLTAVGAESGFEPPALEDLAVRERLPGSSGTDFGIPSVEAEADERPVSASELSRLRRLLIAAWEAFDAAATAAVGHELQKGPRGGGRDRDKIVAHVFEAEEAYLAGIGGSRRGLPDRSHSLDVRMAAVRAVALDTMVDRAQGVLPAENPRRTRSIWSVRYFARRSAWHALDHAWEIEDKVI